MRTVIIGASSGLGRCLGVALAGRGEPVALLARRKDRLDDAAAEGGPSAVAIECDVTDQTSCTSAIEQAAEALEGIDALVYTSGVGILRRVEDLEAEDWARAFATNVTGAALATAAALPHLREAGLRCCLAFDSTFAIRRSPASPTPSGCEQPSRCASGPTNGVR